MEQFTNPINQELRTLALSLPETSEGSSCVNRAFKARKKNFLFLGEKDGRLRIMLKLAASLDQAAAMNDPRVVIGKFGWVTLQFGPDEPLPLDLLSAWTLEGYRALAAKTLVKQLDARGE